MANLFGRSWTRRELMERVGEISQLGGIRTSTLNDGNENGVRTVEVCTGTGFRFVVLPDRGMDISTADHAGRSLCWRSGTGDVAPAFFESTGRGWLRGFSGGLLTTCGLTYMLARPELTKVKLWASTGGLVIFRPATFWQTASGRVTST